MKPAPGQPKLTEGSDNGLFFHLFIDIAEQIRQNDRVIRKGQRDLTRERNDLERQEKKIVSTD